MSFYVTAFFTLLVRSYLGSCLTSVRDGILCFQYMFAFDVFQHGHLLDSNLVQFLETFSLRQTFIDKDRIEVLHITQTNQLVYRRIIAYITFILRMRVAPLFCCHSKQRHIEYVSFVSINQRTMDGMGQSPAAQGAP